MSDIAREDTLDSAMSGQSHTERLIDSVCAELNAMAVDLKICHTVNGEWPAGEKDTLYKYDHLRRMAVELRKLKSALTQAPASGEVEPVDPDIQLIQERDHWEEKATELAEDVGKFLGIEMGEHSSENCPVQNAIDALFNAHPPAKVPEGIKTRLICALRQYRHNSDNSPDLFNPRDGFVCAYDKDEVDKIIAELTTPTTAATPEAEWVKCADRLPRANHPYMVWLSPEGQGVSLFTAKAVNDLFNNGSIPSGSWMCSGLKRPAPPQEQ